MSRDDLTSAYASRVPHLKELAAQLQALATDTLDGVPHIDRVTFRAKDTKSFIEKALDRGKAYASPLEDIEDQVAGRILVLFRSDIDVVLDALRQTFNPVESKRKEPEEEVEFGYESHHLVLMIPPTQRPAEKETLLPVSFELQVRTLFMHAWAEPQHKLDYKGSNVTREARRELAWIAASAWGADQSLDRLYIQLKKPN
jgi:ppGpp synthetase/RelA/SpoT-type nucleotidyltranferase